MLTKPPTQSMIAEWKRIYEKYRPTLLPNRKSGAELDSYLKSHYTTYPINTKPANNIVTENIMSTEHHREKLPDGMLPQPVTYFVGENKVFVGIDLVTGFFTVEGSEKLHDELFAFRGLDESDLNNFFLVAEYINCLRNK